MPNVLVSKIIPRAKQLQQKEGIPYNAALKKASAEYRAGKLLAAPEKAPKNVTARNKKGSKKNKEEDKDEADGLGDVLVKPLKLKRNK